MNVPAWFRNWRKARRADQRLPIDLNHSARLSLRKLEDRQVLSVSASFLGGVLDVAIDGGTDSNPQHVDNTSNVSITVDALNQVMINGVLVDSDNGFLGVQPLDVVDLSSINVHDVAGAANTIDLSGVTFANGFTHAGGVSVSLNGGTGADTITGSGFNDLINGGLGNDSLRGGGGNDVYQFQDTFGVDTVMDTGGVGDSLDFSAVTSDVTVNLQTPRATVGANSVNFAVAEIDSVVGHSVGNDTFQGFNAASNWNIGATGTDYSSTGAAINASGFETLQGGSQADTFHVASSGSGTLKGGAGADVFDIDATFSGTLDGQTDTDTLQGTGGSIAGLVTISTGDRLSPGDSPGILSTGNLAFANSSTFVVEINDTNSTATPGSVAGTDYDQMQVTGTVTIGTNVTLNLQDLGSTQANAGDVYTIVSNDGVDAVTGTFNGLANGAVVAATGGINYRIFYNGGTGNDVVLIGRLSTLPDVFVSTSFVGLIAGAVITDVDFVTAGDQAGIYGLNGYVSIAEAITGVDAGGTVHVDQGTYLHTGTLAVNKSVTIDGQGMGLTQILKSGAPTGNSDEAIRITADNVTFSDVKLGWQTHNTTDYQGYVVVTTVDNTTISRVLFGSNATGEGYRSAVVFEGTALNGADGLEVSDSIFEGRWGRAAIRDGDAGSGQNFLITRNEFREDHFRWGPIAIGPQDSAGTPNNFAFSGEISFNYFGNGLDTLDFQSLGNQNYTVTITNQGLTAAGLDIVHNTFDWNDSNETNVEGVYAQPAGVYITPSFTANTNQILIQDNIFNNFAYAGPQPGTTDPLWRPTGGVFGGALEFDGADDFGVFNSSLFNVGEQGTLTLWMNLDVIGKRHMLAGGAVEFQVRNTNDVYFYPGLLGNANTLVRSSTTVSAADWTHVAYTWDHTVQQGHIFLDGVEVSYASGNDPNVNAFWTAILNTISKDIFIGYDPGNPGSRNFDGKMDDLAFFNDVLTLTEIQSVRDSGVAAGFETDTRLVAHWDFNQSTGNIATDNKQGIELHLTTNGIVPFGPTYQAGQGRFGGALEFDGANDLATFQDPLFDVGAKGTLNFWVKMDNTAALNQFFEGPGNAGFEFQYRTTAGGQIFGRATTAGSDFVIRKGTAELGPQGDGALLSSVGANAGWHNIQYTWDISAGDASTGEMRIYVDGIETGYLAASTQTLTWASVVDTANGLMHMGYDPGSAGQFFDGKIDDVAWYNDVLTAGERSTIITSGVSAHTDLVANWKFDAAPTVDNTYLGDSGTDIVLYLQQLPPAPPVSGYGVVTPAAAVVLNNVFYNEVAGTYADSNQTLDPSNIFGPTANPFFNVDQVGYSGTTLAEFYRLRFGSSAAYQSTEFEASIATAIPHIGANQENPVEIGTEDILVVGSNFDDLVVVTFTSDNDGFFSYTRDVTGATPDYVGTFNFTDITSFTFDAYGGDDVFIVYQPTAAQGGLYSLVNGINFNGGSENNNGNALDSDGATGGDTLVLLKSTTDQAILDSSTYVFGNETVVGHAGTITLSDAALSTVITFTGTEPIRDELSVNARTFTFASTVGGGNETITVSSPGDTVAMTPVSPYKPEVTSRTLDNLIMSTLGPSVSFNNPHTLLDLNTGIGDDTVNINSIHAAYRAAMEISGDAGFDTVNLNSNLTLGDATVGNTGDLAVTSETVDVTADVATSGMGDISLIASRNISLTSGSSLTSVDGEMLVQANQQVTATAGDFIGVDVNDALIQSTGTGTVRVEGRGGNDAAGSQIGVQVRSGGDILGGTMGLLTVQGTGGASSSGNSYGVYVVGAGSTIMSSGGNVSATGTGGGTGTGTLDIGVFVLSGGQITAGASGTVTIVGQGSLASSGGSNFGVQVTGAGATITSGGGNVQITGIEGGGASGVAIVVGTDGTITTATNGGTVTLIGNSMSVDGTSTISAQTTSSVTILQRTDGVAINLGTAGDPIGGPLNLTAAELDRITAGMLHVGDSNSGAIEVTSDIDLSTGIGLVKTLCLTSGSTVTGSAGGIVASELSILAAGAVDFTDLTTNVTNLAIKTLSGIVTFQEADGFTVTTVCGEVGVSTVNDHITLVSGGDITLLDDVNAGTKRVTLDAGGAIIDGDVVDSATTADIIAGEVDLRAGTGIANGSKLEVATLKLAANTATGDINARDVSGDLTIATLTSGTDGVSITAGTAGDDICVTSVGALTVDAEVSNTGAGDRAILLAADGTGDTNDLAVNDNVTTTGGNSSITFMAGDTVSFAGTTITFAAGTGAVQVRAGQTFNNGSGDSDGSDTGHITMDDGSIIRSDDGNITLTAPNNIQLSIVNANADADATLGDITLTADYAGPVNAGLGHLYASDGIGAISEVRAGEGPNLIGGTATLTAATGIGSAGGGADIDTTIVTLVATNSTSGNIVVQETDTLEIGGTGVWTLLGNGNIDIDVDAGSLTVDSVVTAHGSGSVTLNADTGTVDLNDVVSSTTGVIVLIGDTVMQDANITTGGAGTVEVTADTGSITMADGTTTTSDTGSITYIATANVALDQLKTTSGPLNVTADSDASGAGAITDSTAGETANLVTTGTATLSAATGIGSAGGASDLDTTIGTLVATNTTTGNIFVQETSGLIIGGTGVRTLLGNGNIDIDVDARSLSIDNVVTAHGDGNVTLNVDAGAANLNAAIRSTSGDIGLTADSVNQNIGGDISTGTMLLEVGKVTVTADNGSITMADGTTTTTDTGSIRYSATGSVALSLLTSTSGALNVTAGSGAPVVGAITDNTVGEAANLVTTGTATLIAETGIGSGGGNSDIDTTVSKFDITNSTSGSIDLTEADAVTVLQLSQFGGGDASLRTLNGTITIDNAGVVPNAITFTSVGTLLLDANGGLADVLVNDGIQAVQGHVTVQADRDIVATSAPIESSGGGGSIVLQAGHDIRILDAGNVNPFDVSVAGLGAIRLSASTGVIVLGSQDPNTTPDVTQYTVANDVILRTGTGAVTNTLPLVFNIQSPQVNAQGEVFLNMDIGRPGEKNITVTVFWGDGTFTKTTFADPGNYTFHHRYFGNPNTLDPSAPILVNVQVAHDPHVVLTAQNVNTLVESVPDIGVLIPPPVPAQNINTDLSTAIYVSDARPAEAGPFRGVDSKVFSSPGDVDNPGLVVLQDTTVKATAIPVPGTGLASFPFDVTPPVAMLAIPEATRFLDILQVSGAQLSDSNSSRTELARSDDSQLAERLVTLEVLSPDDTVRQRVVLPETVLEDMLEVIGRLPDGKYRFQLQEPGEERQRLLLEFEVRQGKIADDTEESDRPPSATKKKSGETEGGSEAIPEGGQEEDAAGLDQSIMWAQPPHGTSGEGSDQYPGESLTPDVRAAGDTPRIWGTGASIAARRAWKRAESEPAPQPELMESSSEDSSLDAVVPTSNGHDHTLAGSSVMLTGAMGLWAGVAATSPDARQRSPQPSASLSRAAQLFRKYPQTPK